MKSNLDLTNIFNTFFSVYTHKSLFQYDAIVRYLKEGKNNSIEQIFNSLSVTTLLTHACLDVTLLSDKKVQHIVLQAIFRSLNLSLQNLEKIQKLISFQIIKLVVSNPITNGLIEAIDFLCECGQNIVANLKEKSSETPSEQDQPQFQILLQGSSKQQKQILQQSQISLLTSFLDSNLLRYFFLHKDYSDLSSLFTKCK